VSLNYNNLVIKGDRRTEVEEIQKKIIEYGLHHDSGKTRWDLMPWECLDEVAQVFTFGCTKYAERNWERGIHTGRLIGSTIRHLFEWMMGRDYDIESGIHHLAHAAWNILAIRWMTIHRKEYVDRPNVEGL